MLELATVEPRSEVGTMPHRTRQHSATPHVLQPEVLQPEIQSTFNGAQRLPDATTETAVGTPLPVERPLPDIPQSVEGESASLIQVWEGTVQEVLLSERTMRVLLRAKIGGVADHFADIDLEWVSEQDRDLVRPGAVFYFSLYKARRRGGTIVNSEELRFRRLPAWTRRDARSIRATAERLLAKGTMDPQAL